MIEAIRDIIDLRKLKAKDLRPTKEHGVSTIKGDPVADAASSPLFENQEELRTAAMTMKMATSRGISACLSDFMTEAGRCAPSCGTVKLSKKKPTSQIRKND